MKVEVPDDLGACSLAELRDVARMARELDIAVQVELSKRSTVAEQAREDARFAAMSPGVRRTVQLLEGKGQKRGKWTMLALAGGIACLFNARTCADATNAFLDRVQQERGALEATPSEVTP